MMSKQYLANLVTSVLLGIGTAITPAFADKAIVVGVNSYPGLESSARLYGAVNDANLAASKFQSLGFSVTSLTEKGATKDSILNAISAAAKSAGGDDRFVLYFAGCGTVHKDGDDFLLPYDASGFDFASFISQEDLAEAVSIVPGRSRTVIIDAGFNDYDYGATRHAAPVPAKMRSRFYYTTKRNVLRPDPTREAPVPMQADTNQICYFVAANDTQTAYEREFDSKTYGIFTRYLIPRLTAQKELWGSINSAVTESVRSDVGKGQLPTLSPDYREALVFGSPTTLAIPRPTRASTFWRALYGTHDATRVSFVQPGNDVQLHVSTNGTGYVVLLAKTPQGAIKLLHATKVAAGAQQLAVAGHFASLPKRSRVRAIITESEADYDRLVASFDSGTYSAKAPAKGAIVSPMTGAAFYTSEIDTSLLN
ncbi:MAG TPA: caspase family protein [Capsulimonadaceae bacterium]|jgi:hypothetical protein